MNTIHREPYTLNEHESLTGDKLDRANKLPSWLVRVVIQVRQKVENLKENARENTNVPARQLIGNARQGTSAEVLLALPNYNALQRHAEWARGIAGESGFNKINAIDIIFEVICQFRCIRIIVYKHIFTNI
jgi:hypothetical protein